MSCTARSRSLPPILAPPAVDPRAQQIMKRLGAEDVLAAEIRFGEIVANEERREVVAPHRRWRGGLLARPARHDIMRQLAVFAERARVLQNEPGSRNCDAGPD